MNEEMHTYTGFSCDDKGLKVEVFTNADNCDGSPAATSVAEWNACKKVKDGVFIKVTKPKENKSDTDGNKPDTDGNKDKKDDGAIAIKAASVALLALIGSQF